LQKKNEKRKRQQSWQEKKVMSRELGQKLKIDLLMGTSKN
jgi:hypothetical protein